MGLGEAWRVIVLNDDSPHMTRWVVAQEFLVFVRSHVARKHDPLAVNVGFAVHPFKRIVSFEVVGDQH